MTFKGLACVLRIHIFKNKVNKNKQHWNIFAGIALVRKS